MTRCMHLCVHPKLPSAPLFHCSCSCANPSASRGARHSRGAWQSCTSWHGRVPMSLPSCAASPAVGCPSPALAAHTPLCTRAAPSPCCRVRTTWGTVLHPHPLPFPCPQASPCAQGRGFSQSMRPKGAKPPPCCASVGGCGLTLHPPSHEPPRGATEQIPARLWAAGEG